MATLGDRLETRDRDRFVGREAELRFFDELLGDEPRANVVLVHGPGGIAVAQGFAHYDRLVTGRCLR